MGEVNVQLENRIFALQQKASVLPDSIKENVRSADLAYLQDRDTEATRFVNEAEEMCLALYGELGRLIANFYTK